MYIHQDTHYEIRKSILRLPKRICKEKRTLSTIRVVSKFDEDPLQRAETFNMN